MRSSSLKRFQDLWNLWNLWNLAILICRDPISIGERAASNLAAVLTPSH
jgi:hypothetical protein